MEPGLSVEHSVIISVDAVKLKQGIKIRFARVTSVFLPKKKVQQFKVQTLKSPSETQVLEKQLIFPKDTELILSTSCVPDSSSCVSTDEMLEVLSTTDLEQLVRNFSYLDNKKLLCAFFS